MMWQCHQGCINIIGSNQPPVISFYCDGIRQLPANLGGSFRVEITDEGKTNGIGTV